MGVEDHDIARFRELNRLFNSKHEIDDEILRYYSPDLVWHINGDWVEAPEYRGHEGLRRLGAVWTDSFDEYRWDIEDITPLGDRRYLGLFTHRGTAKLSGATVEHQIANIFTVREGLIVDVVAFWKWDEGRAAAAELSTAEARRTSRPAT